MIKKEVIMSKAAMLSRNTMIRLSASEESIWVYNLNGRVYIGYPTADPVPHLLDPNKSTHELTNSKNEVTDIVQPI
jgi:hypothetical protein